MPAKVEMYSENVDYMELYLQVNKMESPLAQVALINKIEYKVQRWEPLTLQGAGMFHLAFGAILTGVALAKRNQ